MRIPSLEIATWCTRQTLDILKVQVSSRARFPCAFSSSTALFVKLTNRLRTSHWPS